MTKKPKCLETRTTREGFKRRRYEIPGVGRHTTVEVPISVLRGLGIKKAAAYMEQWVRGQERRARGARIDELVRAGVKPAAIAHEVGVTEAAVRLRRTKLNKEKT